MKRDKKSEDKWIWPSLRFHSFKEGKLILINTCENRSYTLTLQVEGHHLLIGCSCGNDNLISVPMLTPGLAECYVVWGNIILRN